MTEPLFSIIIPTYGRKQYLAEAVASVQAQTIKDFECIIVDDASPSPVETPSDPRFRVIRREQNGGQAASFNTGLVAARGRYIAFLDDDDVYLPERLEIAREGLAKASIAICQCEMFGKGIKSSVSSDSWNGDLSRTIRDRYAPQIGMAAVARDRALRFDEELRASADGEWWLRMAQGNTFCTIPRLGLRYRVHSTPRHHSTKTARVEALQLTYDKHRDYYEANPNAKAFHFRRMGLNAMSAGMIGTSLGLFWRSFCARPNIGIVWTAAKSLAQHLLGRTGK